MIYYLTKRLLASLITLFLVLALNYGLIKVLPGNAQDIHFGERQGKGTSMHQHLVEGALDGHLQTYGLATLTGLATNAASPPLADPNHPLEDFWQTCAHYLTFHFGQSSTYERPVISLIAEALPTSLTLAVGALLLIYVFSFPLALYKARYARQKRTQIMSFLLAIGYGMPTFLLALLLLLFFGGGSFFDWFPLRGLTSDDWGTLSWFRQGLDILWHLTLPFLTLIIPGTAALTFLLHNIITEEYKKPYVQYLQSHHIPPQHIFYRHMLRNLILPIVAKLPSQLTTLLFTATLIVEIIFSLEGLGRLGYEALLARDLPLMLGILYIYSLLYIIFHLGGDLLQLIIDPRLHYDKIQKRRPS